MCQASKQHAMGSSCFATSISERKKIFCHPDKSLKLLSGTLQLKRLRQGCPHSSVDSSAPAILLPQVRVPSTPSMIFSFTVIVLYLLCEKSKNKQKEAGFGPFKKTSFPSYQHQRQLKIGKQRLLLPSVDFYC